MNLARLLAAVVLLGSVFASAQSSKWGSAAPGNLSGSHHLFFFDFLGTAATPSEPWRLIPKPPTGASSERNPLGSIRIDQYGLGETDGSRIRSFTRMGHPFSNVHSCSQLPDADATCHMARVYFMALLPNGQPASLDFPTNNTDAGATCYSIRSYVVARDAKDSDSTYPAGYSTCQPSDRYHVK